MPEDTSTAIAGALNDAFKHIRQIHFVIILLSATVAYIAYTARPSSLSEEIQALEQLLQTLRAGSARPALLLEALNPSWVNQRRAGFLGDLKSIIPTIDGGWSKEIDKFLTFDKKQDDLASAQGDTVAALQKKLNEAGVNVVFPKLERYVVRPDTKKALTPDELKAELGDRTFVSFKSIDAQARLVLVSLIWVPYVPAGPHSPDPGVLIDSGTLAIPFALENAKVAMDPPFEQRFPEIAAQWGKIENKTMAALHAYARDRQSVSVSSRKAKIFDIEIEGQEIGLFGTGAILGALCYFGLHLFEVRQFLERSTATVARIPVFLPMWVGAQGNPWSFVFLVTSLAGSTVSAFAAYFRLGADGVGGLALFMLSMLVSVLSFASIYLVMRVRTVLAGSSGPIASGTGLLPADDEEEA